jgi:hypothetical protein
VNTSPNPPSASDHPVIREGLLRDFYDHFETKFVEIWKLLKGGTDKSLVGALSKSPSHKFIKGYKAFAT